MRRTGMILTAVLISLRFAYAGELPPLEPHLALTSEYRQDALDYDGVEKRFFSGSASLSFGKSSANFSYLRINSTRENRFTYSLFINGLSPYFDCVVGHYYLNFGAGLIAGKKRAISPDFFSRRMIVTHDVPFSPCVSGNPLFAFHGIGVCFTVPGELISASLVGFFSFRNRYVRTDREYPDITGTSLNSILIRVEKDYRYSEPVEVFDGGGMLIIRFLKHFTLQWYGIYTGSRRYNNRRLVWDYGERSSPEGSRAFYGYGFCARYQDEYITLFAEAGIPNSVVAPMTGTARTIRGVGVLCGLAFRHTAFSISCTGKITDKSFYSPYSSGRNYAERSFAGDIIVRPLKPLSLGGSFLIEKKIAASGYEQYLPSMRRERIFMKYDSPQTFSFTVKFSHVEDEKKSGIERYLQAATLSRIRLYRAVLFKIGGTVQLKGTALSGSARAGIVFCLFNVMTVNLHYSRFFIAGGNPLYSVISPQRGAVSRGSFVDTNSDVFTCSVSARYHECSLSVRYQHQLAGLQSKRLSIDVSATVYF